jgi:signal transduction histidine kinase
MNNITLRKCHIKLHEIIKNTLFVLKQKISDKNIAVKLECNIDAAVFCDQDLLSVVLKNLIDNAVKYSRNGEVVKIAVADKGNFFQISVVDSGRGISPEALQKLFKFTESVSTPGTNNERGVGLGLIITKSFVELNSGAIFLESEIDKGTSAVFTLPKDSGANKDSCADNEVNTPAGSAE